MIYSESMWLPPPYWQSMLAGVSFLQVLLPAQVAALGSALLCLSLLSVNSGKSLELCSPLHSIPPRKTKQWGRKSGWGERRGSGENKRVKGRTGVERTEEKAVAVFSVFTPFTWQNCCVAWLCLGDNLRGWGVSFPTPPGLLRILLNENSAPNSIYSENSLQRHSYQCELPQARHRTLRATIQEYPMSAHTHWCVPRTQTKHVKAHTSAHHVVAGSPWMMCVGRSQRPLDLELSSRGSAENCQSSCDKHKHTFFSWSFPKRKRKHTQIMMGAFVYSTDTLKLGMLPRSAKFVCPSDAAVPVHRHLISSAAFLNVFIVSWGSHIGLLSPSFVCLVRKPEMLLDKQLPPKPTMYNVPITCMTSMTPRVIDLRWSDALLDNMLWKPCTHSRYSESLPCVYPIHYPPTILKRHSTNSTQTQCENSYIMSSCLSFPTERVCVEAEGVETDRKYLTKTLSSCFKGSVGFRVLQFDPH